MRIVGQVARMPRPHRGPRVSSFGPFRRLLGYVWPHKKYLYPALGCIVLMSFTYSISLGAVPFLLNVLVRPLGMHGWVDQYVAEQRFDCTFVSHRSAKDGEVPGVREGAARIIAMEDESPLRSAGIHRGDFIVAVDGTPAGAADVFRALAGDRPSLTITHRTAEHPDLITTVIRPPPLALQNAAFRRFVAMIPGGITAAQRWRTLIVVLSLMLVVILVGNVARFFAEYLTVLVNCRAIVDLRRQMYAHVLKLPLAHFSRRTADTMSRFVQDTNEIFRGLSNFFEKIITEPFKALGAAAIALWLNWRLTLVVVLIAPVIAVTLRKLGGQIRRANRRLLMGYSMMLSTLESTLTGMRVVKGYGRENYERRRLFTVDRRVLGHQLRMGRIEALTSPFLELLAFLVVAGAILYFAQGILTRGVEEEISRFLGMVVALAAMFDPVRKLSTVYPKIQRANAAADRVFELIDSPTEREQDTGRAPLIPLRRTIEFEDVTFTYPESNGPALRNVSLTVRCGETIALVGPNGSGKTTLVSLLPRFYPLTSGRILIDGQDIGQVSLGSLREQFSLITQESVIFPDTVRANIAYGRLKASPAEIEAAARKAFADEFIRQMPKGYDTVLGEQGATLSGGQRQRIAIARAILRNAPILIFDEATSQVDPESELKIHQALEAILTDRTAFIVAHRHSTISGADRIAVMDEGQIVAVGTHDQLLQACPLYRRLYETQLRSAG